MVGEFQGFTYHHNALSNYRARLDRWYLLHAQQYAYFNAQILIDHSLGLLDHAPLWLNLQIGMPVDDLSFPPSRLLHVNNAYLQHEYFQQMIELAIHPLPLHAQKDISYAWDTLSPVCRLLFRSTGSGIWLSGEMRLNGLEIQHNHSLKFLKSGLFPLSNRIHYCTLNTN